MSYLERLRAQKQAPLPTAKTDGSPFVSSVSPEDGRFWRLRIVEDGVAWDVSTLPECSLAEARQLWPNASSVEGIA